MNEHVWSPTLILYTGWSNHCLLPFISFEEALTAVALFLNTADSVLRNNFSISHARPGQSVTNKQKLQNGTPVSRWAHLCAWAFTGVPEVTNLHKHLLAELSFMIHIPSPEHNPSPKLSLTTKVHIPVCDRSSPEVSTSMATHQNTPSLSVLTEVYPTSVVRFCSLHFVYFFLLVVYKLISLGNVLVTDAFPKFQNCLPCCS